MPRWPGGLHAQAGSQSHRAVWPQRYDPTPQQSYWRQAAAELKASVPPVTVNGSGLAASVTGPMGVGEKWQVTLVQVQVQPSLLTHPCTAQVWRGACGVTLNLLGQTSNGGYDDLGVQGQLIHPGEQVIVIWSGAHPGDVAWATIEGTKTILAAYAGQA